jgi:ABC-type polysaccharide/polyol phosphate export permease
MRAFLILVKLRLLDVTRRPVAGFFILILPVLLLLVVGGIFANGHPFERHRVSLVAPDDPAEATLARLPGLRLRHEAGERAALGALQSRMTEAALVRGDAGARLLVRRDDELFGRGLAAAIPGGAALEIVPAPRWGYLHYLFPGMLALSVVLTGLYGMGGTMVRYRATQFLKKLSTTPLPRSTFVGAQLAARTALSLAQTVLMLLAAWAVFEMPLSAPGAAWLFGVTALGLLTFMGAGFALACVIRAEGHMQDVINAITGPLVLLSEVFFPAEELPGPLPAIAAALPSTQMVRLIRAVLLQDETRLAALGPGLANVTAWMVVMFAASLFAFRWND